MTRSTYQRLKDALEPLRPVYDAWMALIAGFSWVLARVTLTLLFFTGFLVYGILLRLFRRDPMRRRLDPDRETYWRENTVTNPDLDRFKKLY